MSGFVARLSYASYMEAAAEVNAVQDLHERKLIIYNIFYKENHVRETTGLVLLYASSYHVMDGGVGRVVGNRLERRPGPAGVRRGRHLPAEVYG